MLQSCDHKKIGELNDRFRQSPVPVVSGKKLVTRGLAEFGEIVMAQVWMRVQNFVEFNEDNDPYGERDFGSFTHDVAGKIFWKIDIYADSDCKAGSVAPDDPERSFRVLTIMLAEEY